MYVWGEDRIGVREWHTVRMDVKQMKQCDIWKGNNAVRAIMIIARRCDESVAAVASDAMRLQQLG